MRILLIAALLLAIPTNGISLVIYAAIYFGKAYFEGKATRHEENKAASFNQLDKEGPKSLPSWATVGVRREQFFEAVALAIQARRIPEAYLMVMLNTRETLEMLLGYAADMESRGATFLEQQEGVCDLIGKMWARLDPIHKQKIQASNFSDEQYRSLHTPQDPAKRLPINKPTANPAKVTQMIEWAIETLAKEPSVLGTAYKEISYDAVVAYIHERKCMIVKTIERPDADWIEFMTSVRAKTYRVSLGIAQDGTGSVLTSHPL